jgi:hypothetical protein
MTHQVLSETQLVMIIVAYSSMRWLPGRSRGKTERSMGHSSLEGNNVGMAIDHGEVRSAGDQVKSRARPRKSIILTPTCEVERET